jgi:hypothetical protein
MRAFDKCTFPADFDDKTLFRFAMQFAHPRSHGTARMFPWKAAAFCKRHLYPLSSLSLAEAFACGAL